MDKSLLVFIAIGIGFLYVVTNFVGELEKDDNLQNNEYMKKHKYDVYQSVDSIGQEILDMTGTDANTQIAAWNSSQLKEEFLTLFPDFEDMKFFVKERVRGKILQEKLARTIEQVENKYFSGTVNTEDAKRILSTLR